MRPISAGIAGFLLIAFLGQLLPYQRYVTYKEEQLRKTTRQAQYVKERLRSVIAYSLAATKTLAVIVEKYGIGNDFESVARSILDANPNIDVLELTRNGVITHVYPMQDNASVLGLDVLSDSLTRKEAMRAIETNSLYFAGPLNLRQGGKAVVGRLPIYIDREFFGFSVAIIHMETLLSAAGITNSEGEEFYYQLSKVNPYTGKEEFFLPAQFDVSQSQTVSIDVPDGQWRLFVTSVSHQAVPSDVIFISVLAFLVSIGAGLLVWYLVRQPERLNRLVRLKVAQATKLHRLFEVANRINHLIVHLKNDQTVFEEVCSIAVETGGFRMAWIGIIDQQEQCLRAVAWAGAENGYLGEIAPIGLGPDAVKGPFAKVLETGRYVAFDDIENDVLMKPWAARALQRGFRSSLLLPVKSFGKVIGSLNLYSGEPRAFDESEIRLLQDVTDDLSFALENIRKEKMLRLAVTQMEKEKIMSDSIINSLPGIFYLYDDTGKFIQWNTNFEKVSGYSTDEIARMHPTDFFDKDEQPLLRERIAEVFSKGYADVTANFFTKDRRKIPHFFNGRKFSFGGNDYLIGMGIDISARVRAEQELLDRTEEIRKLSGYLQNIREEERTHIAREIHDVLGQQLTGLKMDTSWIRKRLSMDKEAHERISDMVALLDETIGSVRRIAAELRPGILDDFGLVAALEWQCAEFQKRTGISCKFNGPASTLFLDKKMETNIFRVFQESLTNIARHANATEIETSFRYEDNAVELVVSDNGVGIDFREAERKHSLGIVGMKERAHMFHGSLEVSRNEPRGTRVVLTIPVNEEMVNYEIPDN